MHSQADRAGGKQTAGLPVVSGSQWFDPPDRPFVLRIECPLAFEELVAALYGVAEAGDLASDEELCGSVAVTLLIEGFPGLRERVRKIRADEGHGTVESPAFLALCRQRIAALTRQ